MTEKSLEPEAARLDPAGANQTQATTAITRTLTSHPCLCFLLLLIACFFLNEQTRRLRLADPVETQKAHLPGPAKADELT
ncbi:MAG: hypothetical protein ACYC5A_09035 [Thermoleophilia bacterium]